MITFFVMSSRSIFMVAINSAKISWLSSRSCAFLGWVTVWKGIKAGEIVRGKWWE